MSAVRIILAYLAVFGLILAISAVFDPVRAGAPCQTNTLSERLAIAEDHVRRIGGDVVFATETGGKGVTRLIIIVRSKEGISAAVVLFKGQCQMPLPVIEVSPEEMAVKHFRRSLADLFPTGTEI